MNSFRLPLAILIVVGVLFSNGCRRAPKSSPQYYEREYARMQEMATPSAPVYLPDRYPWQGRTSNLNQLPERIDAFQKSVNREICAFNRVMYGPPKTVTGHRCWQHPCQCANWPRSCCSK
jgi:hypothetical protein